MGVVAASKTALIVVDFQEDFCEPVRSLEGSLAVKDGRGLATAINSLLKLPFALKIATRDWHPANHISFASQHIEAQPFSSSYENINFENPDEVVTSTLWPDHCIQGTKGAEIVPELDQSNLSHIVDKGQHPQVESYSAFGPPFEDPPVCRSDLSGILREAGIEHVVAVGLAFDYCVKHTALDAAKEGFKVFVVEDACKAVDQSEDALASSRLQLRNAGVKVVGIECEDLQPLRS